MAPTLLLRWVLLWHECPPDYRDGSHWDLMLERAGVADERRLATWALSELPAGWPGAAADAALGGEAVGLADHRAAYLEFEGPISGNRGTVSRIARGEAVWREAAEQRVVVQLRGDLCGELVLAHIVADGWWLAWREGDF